MVSDILLLNEILIFPKGGDQVMNPRQFLLIGGIVLLFLGISGYFILGPNPESSLLGSFFWLDGAENIAHLLFGAVALLAYFLLKDAGMQKILVILVGLVALVVTVLGFMSMSNPIPNVGVANLESPADNILHLVVALWAFGAVFMGKGSSMSAPAA